MQVEELYKYQGTNPKPADFDQYWERAIDEMNAVDPKIEVTEADFENKIADCYHMYFTGTKNARIYAKLLIPKNHRGRLPVMLPFHGYTANSGDWADKLVWAASGFVCAALDVRGQGGRSEDVGGIKGNTLFGHVVRGLEDHPDKLLLRDIFLDTALLVKILQNMPQVDPERICALGGSMGGGLTIACAALAPVKRLAPTFPAFADYKKKCELNLTPQELVDYFRFFDPLQEREEETFNKLGYIDIQHLADRITGNTLMATGLQDKVCPPETVFSVYNKIKAKKNILLYPHFKHEGLHGFSDIAYNFLTHTI